MTQSKHSRRIVPISPLFESRIARCVMLEACIRELPCYFFQPSRSIAGRQLAKSGVSAQNLLAPRARPISIPTEQLAFFLRTF